MFAAGPMLAIGGRNHQLMIVNEDLNPKRFGETFGGPAG